MSKRIVTLFLALVMVLGTLPVFAANDRILTAEAAYGTPVLDGEIDEVWDKANYNIVENSQTGEQKYKGWFKVLWDEENIYVLAYVYGTNYNNTTSGYMQDSVDIYVDEGGERGATFDGNDYQLRTNFVGDISGNSGISGYDFDDMNAVGAITSDGFILEMSFKLMTKTPAEGVEVGFEIQMNQSPGLGVSFKGYLWNCTSGWVWNKPDCYGKLVLKKDVSIEAFNEPTYTEAKAENGYVTVEDPLETVLVNNTTVMYDSKEYTYPVLQVNEYPAMAIDELAKVLEAQSSGGDTITKNGVAVKFIEGERLAEYNGGHLMLERAPVKYEGKLYVPVSFVEPVYAYMMHYNRFDNVLKFMTGTDYPATEVVVYAHDYGALGDGIHDDGPAIKHAINAALATGKPSKVVLDGGKTYLIGQNQQDFAYFTFLNVENFILDGQGSELLFETATNAFLHIESCSNIKICNLEVDYKELLFTQGRIKSVDPDNGSWTMEIDEGFPLPTIDKWAKNFWTNSRTGGWWFGQLMDPVEDRLKFTRYDNYFVDSVKLVEGRTYKITIASNQKHQVKYAEVGDRFVINTRYSAYDIGTSTHDGQPDAMFIYKSGDITIENLNLYASAWLGASVGLNWGRIRFINYGMVAKPGRLLAANSDGIHCFRNRGGLVMENCLMMNNLDDHVNTKSEASEVRSVINNHTFKVYWDQLWEIGDEMVFYHPANHSILGRAFLKEVKSVGGDCYELTVDRDIEGVMATDNPDTGLPTAVYNVNCSTRGSVFKNNTFKNSRRHALISRSRNSIFENNQVIDCGGAAVMGGNEHSGGKAGEGPFPSSFTMKDNYVKAPGITTGYYPIEIRCQLSVVGEMTVIDGFLVEGNTIEVDTADSTIWAFSVKNLYLLNNTIKSSKPLAANTRPVQIQNSEIKMIDGITLDYEQAVPAVVTIAACQIDENNIKNIKDVNGKAANLYVIK